MIDTIISNEDVARILKEIDFFLRLAHAVSLWPREVMEAVHLHGVTELPHIDGLVDAVMPRFSPQGTGLTKSAGVVSPGLILSLSTQGVYHLAW